MHGAGIRAADPGSICACCRARAVRALRCARIRLAQLGTTAPHRIDGFPRRQRAAGFAEWFAGVGFVVAMAAAIIAPVLQLVRTGVFGWMRNPIFTEMITFGFGNDRASSRRCGAVSADRARGRVPRLPGVGGPVRSWRGARPLTLTSADSSGASVG
jgi:hypothetical protein